MKKLEELIERIDVPPEFAEADVLIINLRKANAESLVRNHPGHDATLMRKDT